MFSPEFREDAVRLVIDSSRPIASVARELGIGEGTLGNWVNEGYSRGRPSIFEAVRFSVS